MTIVNGGMTDEKQRWQEYFLPRAEGGDPEAQIAVAIGYANGNMLPKDLQQSELWFRAAANKIGEKSFFCLLKILAAEQDSKIEEVFSEKSEWELGAVYLIYGRYLVDRGEMSAGLKHLKTGWEKGNLVAGAEYIRHTNNRYWKYVISVPLVIRFVWLKTRDSDDPRVLQ